MRSGTRPNSREIKRLFGLAVTGSASDAIGAPLRPRCRPDPAAEPASPPAVVMIQASLMHPQGCLTNPRRPCGAGACSGLARRWRVVTPPQADPGFGTLSCMAIVSSQPGSSPPEGPGILAGGQGKTPSRSPLIDPRASSEDHRIDGEENRRDDGLRPRRLADYIGQRELKQVLAIAVEATRGRGEALDHVLLHGPPGLGKTTMALVLAEELGVRCRISSAPALERPRDIVGLLVNLQPNEVRSEEHNV